jgi:hypothetical protein
MSLAQRPYHQAQHLQSLSAHPFLTLLAHPQIAQQAHRLSDLAAQLRPALLSSTLLQPSLLPHRPLPRFRHSVVRQTAILSQRFRMCQTSSPSTLPPDNVPLSRLLLETAPLSTLLAVSLPHFPSSHPTAPGLPCVSWKIHILTSPFYRQRPRQHPIRGPEHLSCATHWCRRHSRWRTYPTRSGRRLQRR